MRVVLALSLILNMSLLHAQTNEEKIQNIIELKRIAFGSCNNQNDEQPLWKDLIRQKPDLWIWGGDNVYADWKNSIAKAYAIQNAHPDYQSFKEQTPIIGTWDDHDYAYDNANGYYTGKKESQELHLDFMEVSSSSPRRQREGIYTSYTFGPLERQVRIILLDGRYFKDLDSQYPILGKEQWEWLEQELTDSKAKMHFIVSGLSVLSPLIPYTEEWAHYNELDRMLNLIKKTRPKGVLFLTGDKHFSTIFKNWGQLEFLSSGMTHIASSRTWWYLGRKFPNVYFGLSYGQIDIAWPNGIPMVTLSKRTSNGRDVHKYSYKWLNDKWTFISPLSFGFPNFGNL